MTMPASTPSEQGVDAQGLLALLDAADDLGLDLHSLMVARHGHVVAAGWWRPYAPELPHLGHSLSKSLTATAVGLLLTEGRLGLEDRLVDLLPGDHWAGADERWGRVLVEHALSMSIGHDADAWAGRVDEERTVGEVLAAIAGTRLDHEPGAHFAYNQVCTYLLARVVAAVTGEQVSAYLRPRFLDPLGLPPVPWHTWPRGHELGFTGAHLTTATVLALAQAYLDDGRVGDVPVLDPAWTRLARRSHVSTGAAGSGSDWAQGYGFSFWQSRHGVRGDGAFGQFAVVLPEQDAAVAITAETERMQEVLDLLWTHVLPALGREGSREADEALSRRLAGLAAPALGSATGLAPRPVAAPGERTGSVSPAYAVGPVTHDGRDWRVTLLGPAGPSVLTVGDGRWAESTWSLGGGELLVAGSGGLTAPGRFEAVLRLLTETHALRLVLEGDRADLSWRHVPLMGADPAMLVVARPVPAGGDFVVGTPPA